MYLIQLIIILFAFYISTVPPTVHALAVNNSVVGIQGMSALLRFQITATPSVNRNDIVWTFNRNLNLNTLTSLHGAGLSFSSYYLSLNITNINCNVGGRYELSASNIAGESSNYTELIVDGKYTCLYIIINNCTCVQKTATWS